MPAQPAILKSFTDAAGDAVAKAIAGLQRDAARDRELMAAEHRARLAELEARIAAVAELERRVAAKLDTIKDGEPGRSVTVEDVAPMLEAEVARQVAEIPPPKPDFDGMQEVRGQVEDLRRQLNFTIETVQQRFDDIPEPPELPDIPALVNEAVAALPAPRDGKSVTVEDVAPLLNELVAKAVEALPPPEKGDPGPMGALPVVKAWEDRVHYQGDVVTFDGGLFQAARDTGKAPPQEDWVCIVKRGDDGKDADEIELKATFDPSADYRRLNVVALNGAAFMARKDAPGACPGEGWQMIAMQGKQGKPGIPGQKGPRGLAVTASVSKALVTEQGMLTLVNADGSTVECDFYPVLAKMGR
jgi:hypothetical protein